MAVRILKFLLLVLVLGTISYLFAQNRDMVLVTYWFNKTWQASLAVVLLVTFFLGALTTACIAFIYGAMHSFSDWRRNRIFRQLRDHLDHIAVAREKIASGNYNDAKSILEKIVVRDPEDIVARVMLAETLRNLGDTHSALRTLEEVRAAQQSNIELLFLAADLNLELGNATAAFDNMSLVYKKDKYNLFALNRLVTAAEALGRYEEAVEYQNQLVRLSSSSEQSLLQDRLAELELGQALKISGEDIAAKRIQVEQVLKQHREYAPALATLAQIEWQQNNLDKSNALLLRAFQSTDDGLYLKKIALSCLSANEPEKALKLLRGALADKKGDNSNRIYLIALQLRLEMLEEALAEIEKLEQLDLPQLATNQLALLKARTFERQNKPKEALSVLRSSLAEVSSRFEEDCVDRVNGVDGEQTSLSVMQLAGISNDKVAEFRSKI